MSYKLLIVWVGIVGVSLQQKDTANGLAKSNGPMLIGAANDE
jgi:hypothetical protein